MPNVVTSHIFLNHIDKVWDILRSFNGHEHWHPNVANSQIEKGEPVDKIGCIRNFRLKSGEQIKEQLLTLSDSETMFRYSIIEAPFPLFNYIAELRLIPVTGANHCFIQWKARFQTPSERNEELTELVKNQVQRAGIQALEKEIFANVN